jgi:hypothetical protein
MKRRLIFAMMALGLLTGPSQAADDPVLQIWNKRAELTYEYLNKLGRYGPCHPSIVQTLFHIAELDFQLVAEIRSGPHARRVPQGAR